MSEPAKDEAALVARITGALWNYQGAHHADIVLAAIRAAGWAVVPMELTEEMRRAAWKAQYRFANIAFPKPKSEKKMQQLIQTRMDDRYQQEQDRMAYAAMLATAPGVTP